MTDPTQAEREVSDLEAELVRLDVEFARRRMIITEAEAAGLIDYLTCPACHALVPIPADAGWPDRCPRCGRCV